MGFAKMSEAESIAFFQDEHDRMLSRVVDKLVMEDDIKDGK